MSEAYSNLLKHLGKLHPTEQERVYHWLKRYVDPVYSVGGRLLDEMREMRFSKGFECPHCTRFCSGVV